MGIYIDYAFQAKCSEEELVARLRRLRRKLLQLPFDQVSRVLRVNPVYQSLPLRLLSEHGYQLRVLRAPRLVAERRPRQRGNNLCTADWRSAEPRGRGSQDAGGRHRGHERPGDAQLQPDPRPEEGPEEGAVTNAPELRRSGRSGRRNRGPQADREKLPQHPGDGMAVGLRRRRTNRPQPRRRRRWRRVPTGTSPHLAC